MPHVESGLMALHRPLMRLQQVHKMREKAGQRFELQVPSFVLQPGEFLALIGTSGCGKSTLLDMLALVLRPTSAESFTLHLPHWPEPHEVMALPEVVLAGVRRAEIGYVLQTGGLLPFLTVRENVMLPCRLNGMGRVDQDIEALVERLGIADQLTKKPQFLSSGQRQRVAIARALSHRPVLVLADEPTAAVDRPTALDICATFRELTQQVGMTLCMVTHDEGLVVDMADRVFSFEVAKQGHHATYAICYERP
jgi:putative ABC transport system ATP-binding protein